MLSIEINGALGNLVPFLLGGRDVDVHCGEPSGSVVGSDGEVPSIHAQTGPSFVWKAKPERREVEDNYRFSEPCLVL